MSPTTTNITRLRNSPAAVRYVQALTNRSAGVSVSSISSISLVWSNLFSRYSRINEVEFKKSHLFFHLSFHRDKSSTWDASMIFSLSAMFVRAISTKSFANSIISFERTIGSSENIIGFAAEDGSSSSSSPSASHLRIININGKRKFTLTIRNYGMDRIIGATTVI